MKETGLMFKASLVRAILSGQKTQTRRLVKWKSPDKGLNIGFSGLRAVSGGNEWVLESSTRTFSEWRCRPTLCPLGRLGDRIYVRETWNWFDPQEIPADRAGPPAPFTGIAGGERPIPWVAAFAADGPLPYPGYDGRDHWRPSIHMPKWAARIWLEITGVRVERLQAITEADCVAGGAFGGMGLMTGPAHFRHIWESTGGDWAANPWVWAIDFKTISTTGRPA